ncbi:MAG: SlyX family protein [Pseudomonadota bacterium]
MSDDRLTSLEEAAAHQTATLEDLSAIVHQQAKQIEVLERRVTLLLRRAAEAEADNADGVTIADQKPPHY